jgi:hypothetical protein
MILEIGNRVVSPRFSKHAAVGCGGEPDRADAVIMA